mgnify:CR=1 FL=1
MARQEKKTYDLSEAEQRVFARLSVFAGGFTGPATLEVCADELVDAEELVERELVEPVVRVEDLLHRLTGVGPTAGPVLAHAHTVAEPGPGDREGRADRRPTAEAGGRRRVARGRQRDDRREPTGPAAKAGTARHLGERRINGHA